MLAFANAIRVSRAAQRCKRTQRREFIAAEFADVFFFLATFVKLVLTFAYAIRVPRAAQRGKRTHRRELIAAKFTIVVFHDDLSNRLLIITPRPTIQDGSFYVKSL